ncbi:MAG: peptide-methionine (S)-S-oxide reductase MsrA, partial [Clostridia bacterium]|nr:peptide-methionine (S)-S-oxide reductase MsrA [Clostridia bacterium]
GTEKYFAQFDGVISTKVGYANGLTENPTYEDVKKRGSGHAETVRVEYDDGTLPTETLLRYYFEVIDPFSVNRQGEDEGVQYRTGIYWEDETLVPAVEEICREVERQAGRLIAVEREPLRQFYTAEEYHQHYLDKNPGGYCHIPQSMLHRTERKE